MDYEHDPSELLQQALLGDSQAAGQLFTRYEPYLRKLVRLRIDRRIQGRVGIDDILQEIYLEYARCLPNYPDFQDVPFHLWLRMIAIRKLQAIYRHHLGVAARNADREVAIFRGPLPDVSSCSLAIQLLGIHTTPTQAAVRAELQLRVQAALDEMDPIDREILALRHFEELSNSDVACVLGISPTAASNRFIRALRRVKRLLESECPQVFNRDSAEDVEKEEDSGVDLLR